MLPRLICILLVLLPLAVHAQAPGRGKGRGGGGQGGPPAEPVDLNKIIAIPSDLEKGRRLFEAHCVGCHGLKGEGSRGPTLAQPNLPRGSDDASLLRIVQAGIPGTEMPGARLQPGEGPFLAAYVRSLGRIPVEAVPGDPAKGAELFKTKGACMQCHTLSGQGLAIGPDLTDIGRRRSVAFLKKSLVDPGADIPQSFASYRADISLPLNFLFVRVKAKDGREVAGIRVNEDTFSIQLRDLTGKLYSFHKSELTQLIKDKGQSPMPNYSAVFTPAELDDLMAYLVSLRGEKK